MAAPVMDAFMKKPASCTCALEGPLQAPKKVTPKTFTKQRAASAAVSASTAAPSGISRFSIGLGRDGDKRNDWNASHSEANPLNGGSDEMDRHPTRKSGAA